MSEKRQVYIISHRSGTTATRLLEVGLNQFPGAEVAQHLTVNLRNTAEIARVVHAARETNGLVLYTIADPHLRNTVRIAAQECAVDAIDLLEPILRGLGRWLQQEPIGKPGHPFDKKYFDRMEALDFARIHDDGKSIEDLVHTSDCVVVLGVSRTSKTPVCTMLADRYRIKAANVPIFQGHILSPVLEQIDPRRVFVLLKSPERLVSERRTRRDLAEDESYIDLDVVRAEARYALSIYNAHPDWKRIWTTSRAAEDTAALIRADYLERFAT